MKGHTYKIGEKNNDGMWEYVVKSPSGISDINGLYRGSKRALVSKLEDAVLRLNGSTLINRYTYARKNNGLKNSHRNRRVEKEMNKSEA